MGNIEKVEPMSEFLSQIVRLYLRVKSRQVVNDLGSYFHQWKGCIVGLRGIYVAGK